MRESLVDITSLVGQLLAGNEELATCVSLYATMMFLNLAPAKPPRSLPCPLGYVESIVHLLCKQRLP